jgi:hypothetical protein
MREKDVQDRRVRLWRRGELTETLGGKLDTQQERVAKQRKKHQESEHADATRLRA